jgi:DNA-binding transcriptional MerR regulator
MEGKIDKEWLSLLIQAKQIGISIEEIRAFLRQEAPAKKKNSK